MCETFIYDTLDLRWFLLKKNVIESSRAVQPLELLNENINFPTAILCVYTFSLIIMLEKSCCGIMILFGVVIRTITVIVFMWESIMM